MPKAGGVGEVVVPGVEKPFEANVAPDPFDARDLLYRPRLQVLDDAVDRRPDTFVMTQEGSSCTGHAVAAMINTVLAQKPGAKDPFDHVSPYMLYYLARRYDEFPGEDDLGSSLRGVLKGWWRHGVALQDEWKFVDTFIDLEDETLLKSCRKRPLGAFYRVDTQRLDDMQSAITELHAVVASAQIHSGWENLVQETHGDKTMFVIRKKADSKPLGGHAFALVGYNEVGFLVQNSWGETWGKGGFATLPYEEWLQCAYDAWVARPGVPQTPFETMTRAMTAAGTIGVAAAPPPDVIRKHVLNVGNDGRLSINGAATSSAGQLRALIDAMKAKHLEWNNREAVIYIHGGLNSESSGLNQVQEQFQWWLNNKVYPIFIVWQSGALDSLIDTISDRVKSPFGATNLFIEALDRAVERVAAGPLAFAWAEMKENAMKASGPLAALPANDMQWFKEPGASLLMQLLKKYRDENGGLRLHVVAHSAGAVYVDGMVPYLEGIGMNVESLTYMAAANHVDQFNKNVVPRLGTTVKRLSSFTLSDDPFELDDTTGPVYHKSLLYLVSRGFERPKKREEPLVGMQRFAGNVQQAIPKPVVSSETRPPNINDDSFSTAHKHGSFHNDIPTMTAVLLRILGLQNVTAEVQRYKKGASPVAAALVESGPRIPVKEPALPGRGVDDVGGLLADHVDRGDDEKAGDLRKD